MCAPTNVWTNTSVNLFCGQNDPIVKIKHDVKKIILNAYREGWGGPPYDPFELAEILGISTTANESVLDARITRERGKYVIEYNPNKSVGRVNYSVAHEIVHTLFPECGEMIRERRKVASASDGWQLEMLCNVGAAELLMPIGSFPDLKEQSIGIDDILEWARQFEVSVEAALNRVVKLTETPCLALCASRRDESTSQYYIDYLIPSRTLTCEIQYGLKLPEMSCVRECSAIGFTAKNDERWGGNPQKLHVECVGLPPYPNCTFPRVAGIAVAQMNAKPVKQHRIEYLRGDATKPGGGENKIIAFIINDKANSWGAGFAKAVQNKWPMVLEEFKHWKKVHREEFSLGNNFTAKIESNLRAVMMISQHGYGPSKLPRIRYKALYESLSKLSYIAKTEKASVHMPRIGCGQAGGTWDVVSEMVEDTLCSNGVDVAIYDLPGNRKALARKKEEQRTLWS